MSNHKHLLNFKGVETIAEELYKKCLILPSHPNLKKKHIEYICDIIKKNIK
jgi:dTDP-4-amino-4,6-dideoxygalactose transaminase